MASWRRPTPCRTRPRKGRGGGVLCGPTTTRRAGRPAGAHGRGSARAGGGGGEERAGEQGADLLGFYHSHPDHPARPSQYDLDHAWPSFSYVIVCIKNGGAAAMTGWALTAGTS